MIGNRFKQLGMSCHTMKQENTPKEYGQSCIDREKRRSKCISLN